jgi:serine protease Do
MKKLISILMAGFLLTGCNPHDIRLANRCLNSTVLLRMKIAKGSRHGEGTCSGVYISSNLILTADHCVDMTMDFPKGDVTLKEVWVRNFNGDSAKAVVVKTSQLRDLALIKTTLKGTPVRLAGNVQIGEDDWVIGNPVGLEFVISKGIVSSLNVPTEEFPIDHFVTTAIVLPGNSGGPVFNSKGQLIGILTMSTSQVGSLGAAGFGIAVQINEVKYFLRKLR